MKEKDQKAKVGEKVAFAGAKYEIERNKTHKDQKRETVVAGKKLGGACEGLDDLMMMIGDKDKNINCMQKTRMDWDKHTKEENIEA